MLETLHLRLKMLVAEHGRTVVGVLAALAVVSLVAGVWFAAVPETATATQETNVQTVDAAVSHSAVITGNSSIWSENETVRDQPVYFLDLSPHLQLQTTATVPGGESVAVEQWVTVVMTASRGGSTFYTERMMLVYDNTTVTDGQATATGTMNVTAVENRLDELSAKFGSAVSLSRTIQYNVSYDTGTYSDELTATTQLQVQGDAYWLDGSVSASNRHAQPVTQTTSERRTMMALPLFLLAVVAGGGAASVRGARSNLDRGQLIRDIHESRMSDWISEGEIPLDIGNQHVRLESLVDLVDIGIDNEKRAIHDSRCNVYAVVDGNVVYYYAENRDWFESPWNMGEEGDLGTPGGAGGPGGPGGPSGPGGPGDPDDMFGMGDFDPSENGGEPAESDD